MEACSGSSSSSPYNYISQTKIQKQQVPYNSMLHSVRKPMTKPWKKPVAPLPPTRPKVYKIDPVDFKGLVQKLTGGGADIQGHRLQHLAPPPVAVATAPLPASSTSYMQGMKSETLPLEALSLPPSSYNWCHNFPVMSPGTLSIFDHSRVL